MERLSLLGCALLLLSCGDGSSPEAVPPGPLVYAVDVDSVRRVGWCAADADDLQALTAARDVVTRRLSALDQGMGAVVSLESAPARLRVELPEGLWEAERARIDLGLASLGRLEFLSLATEENLRGTEIDWEQERSKFETWSEAQPGLGPASFGAAATNSTGVEGDGPHPTLTWRPRGQAGTSTGEPALLRLPRRSVDWIGAGHVSRLFPTRDELGRPAIGFEIDADHHGAFGDFTQGLRGQYMAILLEGEVVSNPIIESRISTGGRLAGSFTDSETKDLLERLRSGVGPLGPVDR